MPDDDDPDPWVTDWDELGGEPFDDDELVDDELLDSELLDDEYLDDLDVRPTRAVPLTADGQEHRSVDDDVYDVYDDGYHDDDARRRRRALLVLVGAVLFVLVGVALAAVLIGQGDDDLDTDAASSSSSSTTRATPSSLGALPGQLPAPGVSSTVASGSSTSSTEATTSTTKAAATSTVPSAGPACSATGSTRAPEPGNQPMKVAFCVDERTPKAGQPVTLSGTAEDLDGGVTVDCVKVSWEGEEFGECYPSQSDPPASHNESYTFTHTFTTPGSYTIHVGAQSGKPNGSFAETTLKITVHA